MKKALAVVAFSLAGFSNSYGSADFVCISYLRDSVNHIYCITFQENAGCNAYAWFWDFGNGQTANAVVVSSCFSYPGIYYVKLVTTCQNGIQDSVVHTLHLNDTSIYCNWTGSTDIAENPFSPLDIFPNPVKNTLTLKAGQTGAIVEIYSIDGRSVYRRPLIEGDNKLDLSFLPAGVYFLNYSEMKQERMLKLIKQ